MSDFIKEPVRLRKKAIANGNQSLYLDIYLGGNRKYEFLKLYLIPGTDKKSKDLNKETLRLANAVKAQRIVDIQSGRFGFEKKSNQVKFFDYYDRCAESKKVAGTRKEWRSIRSTIYRYAPDKDVLLNDIDKAWLEGFLDWMEGSTTLAPNSIVNRYDKVKACLRSAYNDELITDMVFLKVRNPKKEESHRQFLTTEELKALIDTPCSSEIVRKSFLFSCLTGLRYSDVKALKWGDVSIENGMCRIQFKQKKTSHYEYLDINDQAMQLMGEPGDLSKEVFPRVPTSCYVNKIIHEWAADAGIRKHITFHCARHTFAVMMLDLGTDIYTVSKLLGHREVATTQIYAKVLDKNKRAAVKKIPKIL